MQTFGAKHIGATGYRRKLSYWKHTRRVRGGDGTDADEVRLVRGVRDSIPRVQTWCEQNVASPQLDVATKAHVSSKQLKQFRPRPPLSYGAHLRRIRDSRLLSGLCLEPKQ
ncbi:hypothetical protein ACJJTC_003748 [Scirpophaga incertulas]